MPQVYDYVIIGSGFGGSVSAMRLTEKGYSVLVLEKGKRFADKDFAKTNWQYWKYVWMPAIRAYGILQISILKGVMVLHGAGLGAQRHHFAGDAARRQSDALPQRTKFLHVIPHGHGCR